MTLPLSSNCIYTSLLCSHVKGFILSHCVGTFNANNLTNNNELTITIKICNHVCLVTAYNEFLCQNLKSHEIVALLKHDFRDSF